MKQKLRKNKLYYIAILLITAVLLYPAGAAADSIDFALAPPSTTAPDGGNAGQISGGNEVAPRGFSIDLNGPDEDGGIYWLQSEYDNYNWNPVFTGVTNGYDEPIPATDDEGNAITYDFYAWVDRNPEKMTDTDSGQPFVALYMDGELVSPFPGTLDTPTRNEDDIRDPSGVDVSSSTWTKRWKVHFTLTLEPGHDYSLAFLQGIVAHNGVTATVNEEGTGYLKGTLTDSEQKWYDAHKFDEYQYREYRYSTFAPSDTPQSKVIDTSVENPYEGIYRTMRFSFTTKTDESLEQVLTEAESLYNKAAAGTEAGQYPQSAIDELAAAIEEAKKAQSASEEEQAEAAATLKEAIDVFEAQCTVQVESVSITKSETDFYVGQTGTAKATVTAVPDKAAYKKVKWSSSDNITIDEKTGKWQIDYGGSSWIKAVSSYDSDVSDTWEFDVPVEEGTLEVSLSQQTQEGDDASALEKIAAKASGGDTGSFTGLKIYTASGVSLTDADIDYIREAFPKLVKLDISNASLEELEVEAFAGMDALETVDLPESLKAIGDSAFSGCTALKSADLPSSIEKLGKNVFEGCRSLGPDFYCYAPEAPETAQTVSALLVDTGVETIHVPYGCAGGYSDWSAYKVVENEEKVITITVTSPGTLPTAAESKLDGESDRNYDRVVIRGGIKLNDTDVEYLSSHFMRATTIDLSATALDKCKARTFIGRTALKKILLPETIGTIGEQAFYGCSNLEEIVLPLKLTKIGNLAFGGCGKLPQQLVIEAVEPPELSDTAFDKTVVKSFLVPGESVEAYKSEYVWKDFVIESQIEVSLSSTSLSVDEGGKSTLTAKVLLKYGSDDSVSWTSSNTDTVTVNSKGEVTGRKAGEADVAVTTNRGGVKAVCHVTVKKSAAPAVTVSSSSYSQLKITWSKVQGASDYEVWRSNSSSGSYVKLKTLSSSTTSYYDSGLTTGTRYYYKVRVHKVIDGTPYYSEFSAVKSAAPALATPKTPTVSKKSSKYVKVRWKGISGETGYQVYRATKKNGKYSKVASVKMVSSSYPYAKIKTKKGKTYYYKVRAYKKIGSKYVYSSFSGVKSYKLK